MSADRASTHVDALTESERAELVRLRSAERRRVRRRELRADSPAGRGPEVISMLGRMLPRLADHIEFMDPAQVRALRSVLALAELDVIRRLRAQGEPWSYIGAQLGITAQAAHQRAKRADLSQGAGE